MPKNVPIHKALKAKHAAQEINRAKLLSSGIVRRDKSFFCQRCELVIKSSKTAHALRHALSKSHICCELKDQVQTLLNGQRAILSFIQGLQGTQQPMVQIENHSSSLSSITTKIINSSSNSNSQDLTISNSNSSKRNWQKLLLKKSPQTQAKYIQHCKQFAEFLGNNYNYGDDLVAYSQKQLDNYGSKFYGKNESQSVQTHRVSALKLFLVQSQGFAALNFKDFSQKNERVTEHHKYLDDATIKLIMENAKKKSRQMLVFLLLLLNMAARAQDIIGISYGLILDGKLIKEGKNKYYEVNLEPKKTKGRITYVQMNTYKEVELLMAEKKHNKESIMFEKGLNKANPWDMWNKKANTWLKKVKKGVKTHDFRKTTATDLYNKTKDILQVQSYLGHSSPEMTKKYIEVDQKQVGKNMGEIFKAKRNYDLKIE